jgi:hypothetical protein
MPTQPLKRCAAAHAPLAERRVALREVAVRLRSGARAQRRVSRSGCKSGARVAALRATAGGANLHVAPRLAHHPRRRARHGLAARSLDKQRHFCEASAHQNAACRRNTAPGAAMRPPRVASSLRSLVAGRESGRERSWRCKAADKQPPGTTCRRQPALRAARTARSVRRGRVCAPSAAAACVRAARRATGRPAARVATRLEPATARRAASCSPQCARGLHGAPSMVAIARGRRATRRREPATEEQGCSSRAAAQRAQLARRRPRRERWRRWRQRRPR